MRRLQLTCGQRHFKAGRWQEAADCFAQACRHFPQRAELWHRLGLSHAVLEQFSAAEAAFLQALALEPQRLDTCIALALLYNKTNSPQQALDTLEPVRALHPDHMDVLRQLARAYLKLNREEDAIAVLAQLAEHHPTEQAMMDLLYRLYIARQAFALALPLAQKLYQPDNLERTIELALCLEQLQHYDQAAFYAQKALALAPNHPVAYSILLNIYRKQDLSLALDILQQATERFPDAPAWFSTRIFIGQSAVEVGLNTLGQWCQEWGERFAAPYYPEAPLFVPSPIPQKKLRIGYVSANFRQHSIANLFSPLFKHADRQHFEIVAYNNNPTYDEATHFFKHYSDVWTDVVDLDDEQLTCLIRDDEIDILVDLAGHTNGNRLLVFARKPAPIQFTGIGYGCSTGIRTIDYRFSDAYTSPPEVAQYFTETICYLSNLVLWSPEHHVQEEVQIEPPLRRNGYLTLGYGNNPIKLNAQVLHVWSRILQEIPDSRLHFKFRHFDTPDVQAKYLRFFAEKGIEPQRLQFSGFTEHSAHMQFYNHVDIVLDAFPYNGGISTCDALSMGVPVITLEMLNGNRASLPLLSHLGLAEFIACNEQSYVDIVIQLSKNIDKLTYLRRTLPQKFRESVVCDVEKYIREIEAGYRQAWHQWCEQAQQDPIRLYLLNGLQAHMQGQLLEAEQAYLQVLNLTPHQADALHALGLLRYQCRDAMALALLEQAVQFSSGREIFWYNLALVQQAMGLPAAQASWAKAKHLNPNLPPPHPGAKLLFPHFSPRD